MFDEEKCYGCTACAQVCPNDCIEMIEDELGFLYPQINRNKCTNCGLCKRVCPAINVNYITRENYSFYSAYNKNEEVVKKSSSGGMFHTIAEWIIGQGGVVFGAAFDSDFMVEHQYAQKVQELEKLYRSKYLQSKKNMSYKKVKQFLDNDRYVMFVGSSCEVAGLHCFLDKEYAKLITMDYVCGSSFSPKVFKYYLEELRNENNSNIIEVNFRDKSQSEWKDFDFVVKFENGNEHREKWYKNAFINGAFAKLYTRNSCYNCQYKSMNSHSDFTCGDMWRKDGIIEAEERAGVSILIVKTLRGEKVFEAIKNKMCFKKIAIEDMRETTHLVKCFQPHKNATVFLNDMKENTRTMVENIWKNLTVSGKYNIEELSYNFGVIGSWNTRAVLRKIVDDCYNNKMIYHICKSSLISMYAPEGNIDKIRDKGNTYRYQMVCNDIDKSFRLSIHEHLSKTDMLLVDFLEEANDLLERENGEIITDSDALKECADEDFFAEYITKNISEEQRVIMWKTACDKWISDILKVLVPERIVLFKLFLAEDKGYKGNIYEKYSNVDKCIKLINCRLEECYNYFIEKCPGIRVIELKSTELYYTDIMHKYGCIPEHLNDEAYNFLAEEFYRTIAQR